jgi:hypothetical protein
MQWVSTRCHRCGRAVTLDRDGRQFKRIRAADGVVPSVWECVQPCEPAPDPTDLLEALSAQLHAIYQREAQRQGEGRHADNYAALKEHSKAYYRAVARFILWHAPEAVEDMIHDPFTQEGDC